MKNFKFNASQSLEVSKALEGLENDTLSSISAELINGGKSETCPDNSGNWSKSSHSKTGCGCPDTIG